MSRAQFWPPGLPLPETCQDQSHPPPSCQPDPPPRGLSWGSTPRSMHGILLSDPRTDLSSRLNSDLARAGATLPPLLSRLWADLRPADQHIMRQWFPYSQMSHRGWGPVVPSGPEPLLKEQQQRRSHLNKAHSALLPGPWALREGVRGVPRVAITASTQGSFSMGLS